MNVLKWADPTAEGAKKRRANQHAEQQALQHEPRKVIVSVPRFDNPNSMAPQVNEIKSKRQQMRQQYLECLSRVQYAESAELRTLKQLKASERLAMLTNEKRKLDERSQHDKAYRDDVKKADQQLKEEYRRQERSRRDQSRKKMENLFMAKRSEVESIREEIKRDKAERAKMEDEFRQMTRQNIEADRKQRLAARLRFAEQTRAAIEKDRLDQKRERQEALKHLQYAREQEIKARMALAKSVKSDSKNRQTQTSQKRLEHSFKVMNLNATEKIEQTRQEIDFYESEIYKMQEREKDTRRRLDHSQQRLQAIVGDLSPSARLTSLSPLRKTM